MGPAVQAGVALAALASAVAAAAAAGWARLLGPLLESVLAEHAPDTLLWKLPALVVAVAVLKALAQWVHRG